MKQYWRWWGILGFGILVTVLPAPLWAQSEEDEITLTPERVPATVAPVGAALQTMPPLDELPLREERLSREIIPEVPVTVVAIPVPMLPRESVGGVEMIREEQVFFNATLGGGSVNSVLGTVNIFRIGAGPQFRLGYDHRSTDGFNGNEPGTGFFRQDNKIETWLRIGDEEALQGESSVRFEESRFGLQGQPRFYSTEQRVLAGSVVASYQWDRGASVFAAVDLAETVRTRTVARTDPANPNPPTALREEYITVAPTIGAQLQWPRLTIDGELSYDGEFFHGSAVDSSALIGAGIMLEAVPLDGLTLGAGARAQYRFDDGSSFPLYGSVAYQSPRYWNFGVVAGVETETQPIPRLWKEYPSAAFDPGVTGLLPLRTATFLEGTVQASIFGGIIQPTGELEVRSHRNRLTVAPYTDTVAEPGFPLDLATFDVLNSSLGFRIVPSEEVQVRFAWESMWQDRDLGVPVHRLVLDAEALLGPVVSEIAIMTPMNNQAFQVPRIDAAFRVETFRDVELRVGVQDMLGSLESRGRTRRGVAPSGADPFVEPGFEVTASVRVSF
jgi:hypothetical protein